MRDCEKSRRDPHREAIGDRRSHSRNVRCAASAARRWQGVERGDRGMAGASVDETISVSLRRGMVIGLERRSAAELFSSRNLRDPADPHRHPTSGLSAVARAGGAEWRWSTDGVNLRQQPSDQIRGTNSWSCSSRDADASADRRGLMLEVKRCEHRQADPPVR